MNARRLSLALLLGACGGGVSDPPRPPRTPELIAIENQQPGTRDWQLTNPGDQHQLEAYGSLITLAAGEALDVKVQVDHAKMVSWTLYRFGWYGGAGARQVATGGPVAVMPQSPCPRDPTTSRIECDWAAAFRVAVPKTALSGVYVIRLRSDDGFDWHVPFVVYDGRTADLVVNVDVTSWQAYNDYGGESLYTDASGTMPHGKAWEVSFERPFADSGGAGRFLQFERWMVAYLEALGYDVSYTTAFDIGRDPGQLRHARAFVSVANDEYWTVPERKAVEAARDAGVNLAFFGADQALWRIRPQASAHGVPERVFACYKADQDRDPTHGVTARFRDPPDAQPENGLVGVMYNTWLLVPQPLVIADGSAWPFAGTGLMAGDTLPMTVGFETDGRYANGSEPQGLTVLAQSPIVSAEAFPISSSMVTYRHASGAEVIGVGTMGWPKGLGAPMYSDPRVARITRNVLDRFVGAAGRKGDPDPAGAPWLTADNAAKMQTSWVRGVTTIAGAPGATQPQDGAGAQARFLGPSGIAVAADGTVFVADGPAHQIRRIANDAAHTVSTWAGDGKDGAIDGAGAQARFRWPSGLAVAQDGTVYVADSENALIRAIAPDQAHTVSTVAGVQWGGFAEGAQAKFDRPTALAIAPDGALLVADMHNCRVRRVDPGAGHLVSTWAGTTLGFADGPGASAQLNNPSGLAVGPGGVVYVLDTYNQAIRRIANDAAHTVTTLVGGDGIVALVDGAGDAARIGAQGGIALAGGKLYVPDVAGDRVRAIVPGVDRATTNVSTVAGSGRVALEDGAGGQAAFAAPMGIAAAGDGSLYVADSGNGAVRRLVP